MDIHSGFYIGRIRLIISKFDRGISLSDIGIYRIQSGQHPIDKFNIQ